MNPYLMTVLANLSFAFGSQFYTHYARKLSPSWVNAYKGVIALLAFASIVMITDGFHELTWLAGSLFFISGFIGLGIGDIFLLKAFTRIGPGRTMVLFGFHPVVVGLLSFFIFNQQIELYRLFGIIFFMACLFIFSLEAFRKQGHWEIKGLYYAFLGMFLDAIGVIITRIAFDMNNTISPFEGNFYRCIGAVVFYIIMSKFYPYEFRKGLKNLQWKSRLYITIGALLGTVISLSFYLQAIRTAHLATVAAISVTSVIFSSAIECLWDRRLPTGYLMVAFVFFAIGMKIILL